MELLEMCFWLQCYFGGTVWRNFDVVRGFLLVTQVKDSVRALGEDQVVYLFENMLVRLGCVARLLELVDDV